jgi:1,4-dihydroxy-2-naphthoate octaprenyltransferase
LHHNRENELELMGLLNAPKLNILRIIRLHIVAGGILAFSVGALLAVVSGGSFNIERVALFYAIVLFGDLSTHFSNDYYDVEVDKQVGQRKFFSGSNILVNHPELRSLSKSISILLLLSSTVLALAAVVFLGSSIDILIIALGANFLGWFYSAPPLRLISRGLGEIVVALIVGFVIPCVGYLSVRGQFDLFFIYFAVPFVMYGLVLSLSLEAPDIQVDQRWGKRNIGVRKGKRLLFSLILAMTLLATLTFTFYAWQIVKTPLDFGIISLFSIVPLTAGLIGFVAILLKKKAGLFSTLNVGSLFFFNAAIIMYLIAIGLNLIV